MNKTRWIVIAVIIIAVAGYVAWQKTHPAAPGALDQLAMCLKDKGAQFYGAFWCPHCKAQKDLFGSSAQYLPYVECSTPDGQSQLAVCTQKGVTGYPTWFFADGSKAEGEQTLSQLAQKTGCQLPAAQ
jgi:thiol-disulfide isomerase/thioredoxin